MAYKTGSGIIEGLEVVRRRPTMYIGEETPDVSLVVRLVESALDAVVRDTPSPTAARLLMWNDGVFTIAFDGEPLPIGPFALPVNGVPHPELYRLFMFVGAAGRTLAFAGAVLNALSEQLLAATVSGGQRYRAVFGRGTLISLLAKAPCEKPLGTNWLTFRPDPTIITGRLTTGDGAELTKRAGRGAVSVTFEDRSAEDADWF